MPLPRQKELTTRYFRSSGKETCDGVGRKASPLLDSVKHEPFPKIDLRGAEVQGRRPPYPSRGEHSGEKAGAGGEVKWPG